MSNALDSVVADMIRHFRLYPAGCEHETRCCGRCYALPDSVAEGTCWFCRLDEHLGFILLDLTFRQDYTVSAFQTECAFLSCFQSISASRGGAALSPGTLYAHSGAAETESVVIHDGSMLKGITIFLDPAYCFRALPEVQPILRQIESCPIDRSPEIARLFYQSKIQELLALYINAVGRDLDEEHVAPFLRREDAASIRAVMAYLRANPAEDTEVAELARIANMSASKLKYTFRAVTGKSIRDYRNDLKLERACALLEDPNLTLAEISARLGFHAPSSFSRFFREQMGISPNAYRHREGGRRIYAPVQNR